MDPTTLITLAAVIAAGYFLMVRPAQRRAKAQQETMNSLEPGARVMTTAGMFGTIVHMGTKQAIIEIAPGVEMTILKQAIAKVVPAADEEFEYDDSEAETPSEPARDDDAAFGEVIKGYESPDAHDPHAPEAAADDATDTTDTDDQFKGYPGSSNK